LRASAPAKANLFLKVLGRRPDGRHDLLCLTVPLTLADELTLEVADPPGGRPDPDGDSLSVADDIGSPCVPTDPALTGRGSLVLRAVAAYRERTGFPRGRVRARILKRIPYCAGLGGVSSDAAAVLRLLDSASPSPLGGEGLRSLALPLGADIPFFLWEPAPGIVRGAGEILAPYGGPPLPPAIVLAGPGTALPTGEVFREYAAGSLREDGLTKHRPENSLNLSSAPGAALPTLGTNDLLPAAFRLSPGLSGLREDMAAMACGPHGLSGSGPTFWALCPDPEAASEAARELARRGRWSRACGIVQAGGSVQCPDPGLAGDGRRR
jgi:4-diphosphocytidyl-2-C-methyl-D-erythritol kinase